MSSDSASSDGSASEPDLAPTTTQTRTQGNRRNPVHYTDGQIVKMIGATATANPYGAPRGSKTKAWETAVSECNRSGLFPFEVMIKGLKDKITSLLHSRAQRLEREGQIAREAALRTFTKSQSAEREQPPSTNEDQATPPPTASPSREASPDQTHTCTCNHQNEKQHTSTNVDPTAVLRQLVKSMRQINQSEGAVLNACMEILQPRRRDLKVIGEETNMLLRSAIPQPPPPVFGYSYAPHIDTPGAGPGLSTQGQKRRRMVSPDNE
ncbi:hypothetical protein FRC11_004777 [Ceratobasidium sp. 423]|nr:hypothetical protein FRC11_004777 [Ceratobasidium sp. 423]